MSLRNVPGQTRAKRFLKQIIGTGHVPHSLLFSGMEGIGKAAMAIEFAKAINCHSRENHDSCDHCSSCYKIAGGSHPDMIWVSADGAFIKLDQIRNLRKRVQFRPFEGPWRIIIIKDAEKLREEAANALLKMLEEPPRQNIFMLLVAEPQKLLSTILSRCCHIRFQPLDDRLIEEHLITVHHISTDRARELARMAGGSLERARCLVEQNEILHWQEIVADVQRLDQLSMIDFFDLMARWSKKSENLERDLEYIKLWLRDIILSRLVNDYRPNLALDGNPAGLQNASSECLFQLYDHIEEAMQHLRGNASKQLVLEGVCLAIKELADGQGCWNPLSKRRQNLSF